MTTRFLSADMIYPVSDAPIPNGVVEIAPDGNILNLYTSSKGIDPDRIERFKGIIVPGFINAHCHLELSHTKGLIPKGSKLTAFLQQVMSRSQMDTHVMENAMEKADHDMHENGIVAVGDISNSIVSRTVKRKSLLYYHTFVEILCFEPEKAKEVFKAGVELCEAFRPLASSVTPHAPYSVCKELFRYIKILCDDGNNLLSIHNQESDEENKFFRYKKGDFVEFYQKIKRNIDFFKAQARNSLRATVPLLPTSDGILMVHNTYTSYKDINFLERYGRHVTWCFCPNANIYIEGKLPNVNLFRDNTKKIVLGTDSLASNDRLSILDEMVTLHQHFKEIPLAEMLQWATLNGAHFLGIEHQYGSLSVGKRPGLNLIEHVSQGQLTKGSTVRKLA